MRIVIVGAGYAGVTCAARLSKRAPLGTEITLVNATDTFVERIRLHQQAAGQRAPEHDLRRMLRGTRVALEVGRATGIDLAAHTLELERKPLGYDELVLALGSRTDVEAAPGVRDHALTLDPGSVARIAERARHIARTRGQVVVVGAGLTGIEAAVELAEAFPTLRITMLTHGRVAEGWSASARAHLLDVLARHGVALREGVRVQRVSATQVHTDQGDVACALCLWTVGFVAHPLARQAGLAVNVRGQVLVDAALRSISHPHVHAAGDATALADPALLPLPMGCKSAGPAGAQVAENLVRLSRGEPARAFDYQAPLFCVSLGRHDGLIQFAAADGSMTGPVWTGRRAATFKELVCRSTMWALALERRGWAVTRWKRTGSAPPRLAAVRPKELSA